MSKEKIEFKIGDAIVKVGSVVALNGDIDIKLTVTDLYEDDDDTLCAECMWFDAELELNEACFDLRTLTLLPLLI